MKSLESVLIVGAGPSGLGVAAALKMRGISSLLIEKEDCIGSLWKRRTYDRLYLHIPKSFCALPHLPFPSSFPKYPSRNQVVDYLDMYTKTFDIRPRFNHTVERAVYSKSKMAWAVSVRNAQGRREEYEARWLVVASGENSHPVLPQLPGLDDFRGKVMHSSLYKNGLFYSKRRVLIVGSGNSGMEIALDLCNYNAHPSLAVRGEVHVLPRDVLGVSTYSLTATLLGAGVSVWLLDMMLLCYSWMLYGNINKLGLVRPKVGPMEAKLKTGKTPVLDVGTLAKIKAGHIKILSGVVKFHEYGATFSNGDTLRFDAIILATGYRSDVCTWLEGGRDLFGELGHPKTAYPGGWKGENGLFAAGLTRRGLQGASHDAEKIAEEILRQSQLSPGCKLS